MRPVKKQSDFLARSPDRDPVFDALLHEALGGTAPPDQTAEILKRIDLNSAVSRSTASGSAAPRETRTAIRRKRLFTWSTLLAAAASLGWIVWTTSWFDGSDGPSTAHTNRPAAGTEQVTVDGAPQDLNEAGNAAPAGDRSTTSEKLFAGVDPQESTTAPGTGSGEPLRDPPRRRPVPMEMSNVPFGNKHVAEARPESLAAPRMPAPPARKSGREIVERIDTHLADAWKALSLVPAESADSPEIVERFERTIAVAVPPTAFNEPEQLIQYISTPAGRSELSDALVDELLGASAAARLNAEQRSILTTWIASAFNGRTGFDEVITALYMGGNDEQASSASQAWLNALAGGQSVPITEQTARALLDLDLQCGRCHEHPIERGIGQQDYWQFAALFNNGLYYTQSEDGKPEVHLKAPVANPSEGMFFELPDGRQRVALPGVSSEWLGVAGAESIDQLSDLTSYWANNPQLAKSTVNRLWKIVYGRPLVGSASDPSGPPRDEHLTELRDFLADQLRAHDFDLAAATSWILAAEPMRLKVAPAMTSEKLLTASTQERVQADYQTRGFAAYQPIERRESFSALIAMAARWNGGAAIDRLPAGSTLAQPIDSGSSQSGEPAEGSEAERFRQQWLRASFPTVSTVTDERPELPAQWIASLKSFEQQARHLYYAAGYPHPSPLQMQAAERLRDSTDDPNLALSQLWWAIENGVEP